MSVAGDTFSKNPKYVIPSEGSFVIMQERTKYAFNLKYI